MNYALIIDGTSSIEELERGSFDKCNDLYMWKLSSGDTWFGTLKVVELDSEGNYVL